MHELVSLREATPTALATVPNPRAEDGPLLGHRPVLAVGSSPSQPADSPSSASASDGGQPPPAAAGSAAGSVSFYSFPACGYVHSLQFHSPVLGLRATAQLVVVALESQIYGFDNATMTVRRCPSAGPPTHSTCRCVRWRSALKHEAQRIIMPLTATRAQLADPSPSVPRLSVMRMPLLLMPLRPTPHASSLSLAPSLQNTFSVLSCAVPPAPPTAAPAKCARPFAPAQRCLCRECALSFRFC